MIVKNEEDWIQNALASVRSVVDEIIIADTGSTDRTIERAERFSSKVLHFKRTDSFADARNFSVAEARHPWFLVLDADESIAARDLPLAKAPAQQTTNGYHLNQRNYVFGNQFVGGAPNSSEYEEGKSYPCYLKNPLIRLFRGHSGNPVAARRILSNLEATPFLAGEVARLRTNLKEEAKAYGREN